ncbi:hypothetical protein ACP275_09G016000 [Erythranthe tilingii]
MDGDSTVVIKVKYGEVLRRFRARVIDGEFSLTVDGLRKKIFSLFGFSPDTEIMLTYIDEDGDVATIVDFVDLCDVVKQGLNPIRFTVQLILENDSIKTNFFGSSDPANSPPEKIDAVRFDSSGNFYREEKPMHETMENISNDMSSKVGWTETDDYLSNLQPITNIDISKSTMGVTNEHILPYVVPKTAYKYVYPISVSGTTASYWSAYCDICGIYPKTVYKFNSKGICTICFSEFEEGIKSIKSEKTVAKDLDSCFVEDVSVAEGSVVPPSTRFTKTWRMRNSGSVVWPEETLLVWTGGHVLSHALSFEVGVPATGLPVGHDLDFSVEFTSPERKGYYTSYWIMKSPSGEQFGELIWIYIQVDDDALNLNLPPPVKAKQIVEDSLHELGNYKKGVEVVETDLLGSHQTEIRYR